MAIQTFLLKDGSTLEVTTTDEVINYREQVVTQVSKSVGYKKVTTRIIPAPVVSSKYLILPTSVAQTISGKTSGIIENLRFENAAGVMITIVNSSNIIIRNCFFNNGAAEAITVYQGSNIRIENCLFNGVTTGVYASTSQGIKVINCQFINMRMRADGSSRGQFVQFNNVTGAGNEVSGNKGENFLGESNPEDMISMFKSSGIATSPILIKNNWGRGGGSSLSGGGIVLGDHGGSYITADENVLLNPGQYGMAIAGGSNMVVTNNKIFSKKTAVSNNPLFIWEQSGSMCANNVIKSNRATWTDKTGALNGGWNAGNCINTAWEKPTPITEAELNFPVHLIDFVTPEELLKLRGK